VINAFFVIRTGRSRPERRGRRADRFLSTNLTVSTGTFSRCAHTKIRVSAFLKTAISPNRHGPLRTVHACSCRPTGRRAKPPDIVSPRLRRAPTYSLSRSDAVKASRAKRPGHARPGYHRRHSQWTFPRAPVSVVSTTARISGCPTDVLRTNPLGRLRTVPFRGGGATRSNAPRRCTSSCCRCVLRVRSLSGPQPPRFGRGESLDCVLNRVGVLPTRGFKLTLTSTSPCRCSGFQARLAADANPYIIHSIRNIRRNRATKHAVSRTIRFAPLRFFSIVFILLCCFLFFTTPRATTSYFRHAQ